MVSHEERSCCCLLSVTEKLSRLNNKFLRPVNRMLTHAQWSGGSVPPLKLYLMKYVEPATEASAAGVPRSAPQEAADHWAAPGADVAVVAQDTSLGACVRGTWKFMRLRAESCYTHALLLDSCLCWTAGVLLG